MTGLRVIHRLIDCIVAERMQLPFYRNTVKTDSLLTERTKTAAALSPAAGYVVVMSISARPRSVDLHICVCRHHGLPGRTRHVDLVALSANDALRGVADTAHEGKKQRKKKEKNPPSLRISKRIPKK